MLPGFPVSGERAGSTTLPDPAPAGFLRLTLTVVDSAGQTGVAVRDVLPQPAILPVITAPAITFRFTGARTVVYAGTATNERGLPLPPSAFTWRVDRHRGATVETVAGPITGVTTSSFVVPRIGQGRAPVFYRVHLTVTSGGLTATAARDILPRSVRVTLDSEPSGVPVFIDGEPLVTPIGFDGVVGVVHAIYVPGGANANTTYAFSQWSDGAGQARTLTVPDADTTYTATVLTRGAAAPPAAAPAGMTAVANGATLFLAWQRVWGAQAYQLEAGSAPGRSDIYVGTIGDVVSVQGVVPEGTYYLRMRAVNANGPGPASNDVSVAVAGSASCTTAPPPPVNYTGQASGLLASLSWTRTPGATAYRLDAGLSSGATDLTTDLGDTTLVQALAPAGTYYTRVRAVNACGSSAPSAEVAVTTACNVGLEPAGLAVTVNGGVATFAWAAPIGATGYRLQVGTAAGTANLGEIPLGNVTTAAANLAGVPPGTYYVRVVAEGTCGIGGPSNEVAVTVP